VAAQLVVGADAELVAKVLGEAGDEDVLVLDGSPGRLERLQRAVPDPRVWCLIGDAAVIPLPDASVDRVVGVEPSAEVARVTR